MPKLPQAAQSAAAPEFQEPPPTGETQSDPGPAQPQQPQLDSDRADQTEAAADANPDSDKPAAGATPAKKAAAKKSGKKTAPAEQKPTGPPTLPGQGPSTGLMNTAGATPAMAQAAAKPASLPGLVDTNEYLSVGFYGKEGTGKTTDALAMANLGPVVLIDAEAGAKPTALRLRGINVANIRVWPNREEGEEFSFDSLEALFYQLKGDLQKDRMSWIGSVWDSLTEISYQFVNNERDRNRAQKRTEGKNVDRWFMDRSFYGVSTSQIQELIRRFRDLPMHFALCALERRDTDDDGKVGYGPAVNPALATDVPGFVDILCHTTLLEVNATERGSGDDIHQGWFRQHGKYRAKDRFGLLPKMVPTPTFDRIHAYVTGELTKETDEIFQEAKKLALGPDGEQQHDGNSPEEAGPEQTTAA